MNAYLFNKSLFISNKFISYNSLKDFQLKKLYKVINSPINNQNIILNNNLVNYNYFNSYNTNISLNFKFSKLIFKKFNFLKQRGLFFYKKFLIKKGSILFKFIKNVNLNNIDKKLIFKTLTNYKYKTLFYKPVKIKKKNLLKLKIKNIYKNKWWFYFLKRLYPYISINFFDFKLKKLKLKIVKFFKNVNLKNLIVKFFKFTFLKNLTIFNFNKKLLIFLKYNNLIKLYNIINLNKKLFNLIKINNFKNWLKVKFYYNLKFSAIYYNYNILLIFYVNFIFKKYLFFKIFNLYINFIIFFIYKKFQYLKNNLNYFSNIEISYDLIKYKDNSKFFIAITPKNIIMTINRRYKKGLEFQKF
jgi:hypothetical protein